MASNHDITFAYLYAIFIILQNK